MTANLDMWLQKVEARCPWWSGDVPCDKIRDYRGDCNNRSSNSISFHPQHNQDHFRFTVLLFTPSSNLRSATFSLDHKIHKITTQLDHKTTRSLHNCTFTARSVPCDIPTHLGSHPTHSRTSRILSTSLSLGTPFPRSTECVRVLGILQFCSLFLTTSTPFHVFPSSWLTWHKVRKIIISFIMNNR